MTEPIRIVYLDCWHANKIIYQAEGTTDDGKSVYVRYRGRWLSVGIGATPDEAAGADTFLSDAHPGEDPSRINLATLKTWTAGSSPQIIWPDRIDGYANEPDDPDPSRRPG